MQPIINFAKNAVLADVTAAASSAAMGGLGAATMKHVFHQDGYEVVQAMKAGGVGGVFAHAPLAVLGAMAASDFEPTASPLLFWVWGYFSAPGAGYVGAHILADNGGQSMSAWKACMAGLVGSAASTLGTVGLPVAMLGVLSVGFKILERRQHTRSVPMQEVVVEKMPLLGN